MGIFKMIRHTDDGLRYLYNALHYTMGIHTDYDKRCSPNVDIYNAYEQFLFVKKNKRQSCISFYCRIQCKIYLG